MKVTASLLSVCAFFTDECFLATIKRPPGATKQAPLKINQTPLKGKDGTNPTKVAGNTSDTSDDEKQIFDIVIGAEGYYRYPCAPNLVSMICC